MTTITPSPLLKWAFLADAGVSGAVALLQLGLSSRLAALLNLPALLLLGTGAFLVGYTVLLAVMARSAALWRPLVRLIVIGNAAWAVGCVVLIAAGTLAPGALGVAYLIVQAVTVLSFAGLQAMGLAGSGRAATAIPTAIGIQR